jgi:hypothetical protein
MNCSTCADNWTVRDAIGFNEVSLAMEKCRVCERNGYKLYTPVTNSSQSDQNKIDPVFGFVEAGSPCTAGMKQSFSIWLKQEGRTLTPWQMEAAIQFLRVIEKHQGIASGKTFLVNTLSTFLEVYGNNFTVE